MKEVLLRYGYGRGLAVSVVIALALTGKAFVSRAHNDPPGTDDVMMNVDLGIDSSKQVALLELEGDGNNVAGYDFTKVDDGVSTVRTLEQPISYTFTKVGDGICKDSNNNQFDSIGYAIADVDECKAKCEECPGQGQAAGRELRGIFVFNYGIGLCKCHFDDGDSFSKSVCPGASLDGQSSGTGPICESVGSYGECWKVVDSNLQCPTPAPTNEPTSSPSTSPTKSPSTAPTAPPSMAPTASPTAPPSKAPTAPPTASPTAPPSMAPTASPTAPPSKAPTAPPTASPTAPPSMAPTETPTKSPTAPPTAQPTSAPTNANTKSGKVAKVAKANGIVDLQVQEMKSGGSSVSISPHVGILALIVASRNLYLLL